ncbi:hypothetical protein DF268_35930 [Streptomyces sp. V2]|uniref:hypothetical protein n=1 Tax=Streptomyces sp. V2 TaxID=1424099 RepID=UPI000D66A35A|nr:hypothetical protein [Streptomyces sp. V2]PWG08763.1 hypothetical protein DF268_35930 [Streptomyces sp. V2]
METSRFWRGPDGRHWVKTGQRPNPDAPEGGGTAEPTAVYWLCDLAAAVQDPDTGRWTADPDGPTTTVPGHLPHAGYAEIAPDPWADPRIATLTHLVAQLLTDHHTATGHPHPRTTDLQHALEDVAFIPVEMRRRVVSAYRQARRS